MAVAATSTVAVGLVGAAPALADGMPAVSVDAAAANLAYALPTSPVIAAAPEALNTDLQEAVPDFKAPAPVVTRAAVSTGSSAKVGTSVTPKQVVVPAGTPVSGSAIVETAKAYVGTPYVSGGASPSGFDCSGFVSYVYAQYGVSIPRTSGGIYSAAANGTNGLYIVSDPQPGDIMWTSGHVGIYVGNGMMIDAPRPGKTVQVRALYKPNWVYIRAVS